MDKGGLPPPVELQSQAGVQRDVLGRRADLDREITKLGRTYRARQHTTRRQNAASDNKRRAGQSSNRANRCGDVALKAVVRLNRATERSSCH